MLVFFAFLSLQLRWLQREEEKWWCGHGRVSDSELGDFAVKLAGHQSVTAWSQREICLKGQITPRIRPHNSSLRVICRYLQTPLLRRTICSPNTAWQHLLLHIISHPAIFFYVTLCLPQTRRVANCGPHWTNRTFQTLPDSNSFW